MGVRQKVIRVTAFSGRRIVLVWEGDCVLVDVLAGHSRLEIQNWRVARRQAEPASAVFCTELVSVASTVRGHCTVRSRPRTALWVPLTLEEPGTTTVKQQFMCRGLGVLADHKLPIT